MEQLLQNLNPVQREAVTVTDGPILIIAGAGSGKTRVLTCRVAYILGKKLAEPYNILAVTFTNKAANEMKERIRGLLGQDIFSLTVSTFHSFCARLLRREAAVLGYQTNFTIFDEDDALALIRTCLDRLNISRTQFTPGSLRRKISNAKNRLEDAAAYAKNAGGYFEKRTAEVYTLYEQRLRECGAMDFDDLIMNAVRLLSEHEEVRKNYQNRFKYILVDEYQDTNHSQYRLLKLLVGPARNICVVGDEDQSIYGWRGADISNILNFESDFPGAKVIKMEQNYRSTEIILEAASAVIANNINRKGKTLWTDARGGEQLRFFMTDSALEEATAVVDELEQNRSWCPLNDAVVLYRTNAQSRAFEDILRRRSIPYQIIGGISFYQRKEIKDLVAYLKLLANPNDDVSFLRVVNYPARGIGESTVGKLSELAQNLNVSLYRAGFELEQAVGLTDRPRKLLRKFVDFMEPFFKEKATLDISALAQKLIDELHLIEILMQEDPLLGESRVENIEEFVAAAREFAQVYPEPTLENFLAEIALYTDIDEYREIEEKVTLMTLHAAKGLEFDTVYLAGLEEGLFPLARAIENPNELEEERRLFYVGATRAKKRLYLSMAAVRNRFGEMGTIPSRFLKELPPALVEISDKRKGWRSAPRREQDADEGERRRTIESGERHYVYEEEETFRAGRIVQHPTFGRGKVIKAEGHGEGLRLEIYFTGIGVKKVLAKFARLKIVG